jgi:hypothetical protein
VAGIFTEETMNNLAGPQLLEPLSFLRPRGKKLPEKIFRPDTNPQRHPPHLCARESRLDAIYEHLRRDASALEHLGMRTAYCG